MPRTSRKSKDNGNTQLDESNLSRSEQPTIGEGNNVTVFNTTSKSSRIMD
jgi:hypothetical protein